MDARGPLIHMLKKLLEDMLEVQQLGAGYYSCIPVARRFNKLLEHARQVFPKGFGLIKSFEPIEENDPKDPGDKYKILQAIRIEIGQLLSLLQSVENEEEKEKA